MSIYRGFSTVNARSQKRFNLTDRELIKQDLLNALNTRLGSRLMLPNEGCVIWEVLYEPLTSEVQKEISDNLTQLVNGDPRVVLTSINIVTQDDQNTVTVEMQLVYTDTNQTEVMRVLFDTQKSVASV